MVFNKDVAQTLFIITRILTTRVTQRDAIVVFILGTLRIVWLTISFLLYKAMSKTCNPVVALEYVFFFPRFTEISTQTLVLV